MTPEKVIPTRCLSVLSCANDFLEKVKACILFHHGKETKELYKLDIEGLLQNINGAMRLSLK